VNKIYLILYVMLLLVFSPTAWGFCPADPMDRGLCDTMYIDPWIKDTLQSGNGPYFVRVPIYVTADVADICDSINAFVIPLYYTHTNVTRYCSLSYYWNNYTSFTNPRSIFRHLVSDGDTIHNWMKDQWEKGNGEEWNYSYLDLNGSSHFWLVLIPAGAEDHLFESGSRILLATMTFKIEDTMSICMDTCLWPPSSRLAWGVNEILSGEVCGFSLSKIPRSGTHSNSYQVCFNLHHTDFLCGDVNADAIVDVGDVVYLINYLFKNGPAPNPVQSGDVNSDAVVDVGDVVYLINYLFKSGPAPSC
jgi:hypothetical protein